MLKEVIVNILDLPSKLEGKHSVFAIKWDFSYKLFTDVLCRVDEVSFNSWFVENSSQMAGEFLSNAFSASTEMNHVAFLFYDVNVENYIDWSINIKSTLCF